jgi:hypothetical protein
MLINPLYIAFVTHFGFVIVRVIISLYYALSCWIGPVSKETGVEPTTWQAYCSEMSQTHVSVIVALKLIGPTCQF